VLNTLKKFLDLLDPAERRRFFWLQLLVVIQGVAETASTLAVVPFVHMLSVGNIESSAAVMKIRALTGIETAEALTIASGVVLVTALVLSNAISATIAYARTIFINRVLASVRTRLFEGYLARDYSFFLRADTTSLEKNIITEADNFITHFVTPLMSALGRLLPALIVAAAVAIINWRVMAAIAAGVCTAYFTVDLLTRRGHRRLGSERLRASEYQHKVLGEAFLAIKEVKAFGAEAYHLRAFSRAARSFARSRASNRAIADSVNYGMESLLVGGGVSFALVLMANGQSVAEAAPVIGLFAMTMLRLLPTINDLLKNSAAFHFSGAAVDHLADQMRENAAAVAAEPRTPHGERVGLERELVLDRVSFRYHDNRGFLLTNVSLRIPARSSVALVGRSGAGKSTLADILLGLLEPQSGSILVDGRVIDSGRRRAWQQSVGYVPQVINLMNTSIAENIAFGKDPVEIDRPRVEEVATLANLHEFVTRLPNGYDTVVGQRGVRLSGGQRQRIGIARALYRGPALLIFDEATNALDPETESAVLEAIARLSGNVTLLIIAHRSSALTGCDAVLTLEDGRLYVQGDLAVGTRRS
jgi:ABC-type multidrug transport system fused ATPase/permease subunit